jgi:transposase-like protein
MPKEYSEELKREAVALVRKGVGVQQAADQFGVPNETLRQWVHDAGISTPSTESVDAATYQAALARIAELERDNEMLAQLAAHFACQR